MARVQVREAVPQPPPGMVLSPVPDKTISGAVDWYAEIGVPVTERWLKTVTDRDELTCRIIAGRRMYSTEELWRFITMRPTRTAGAGRLKNQNGNQTSLASRGSIVRNS